MREPTLQEAREAFAEFIDLMSVGLHKTLFFSGSMEEGCVATLNCGHTVTCKGCESWANKEECWSYNKGKMVPCEKCDELDTLVSCDALRCESEEKKAA